MGKYSVEYLPLAYDDLDDIFSYIVADDPEAAATLLDEIDAAILHLEEFLDMGVTPKNRRLANKGYKMLIVNAYLVFYVVIGDIAEIRRIVSSKRNYTKLL
ncbi:MAG: type II toxin-antitoxin system RelE/ParE family toxin [Syntrophomonas sp.]|nr:type II toxin-antitoxin system RelE/ParE family toxin [Syntrophomonas sp.]